MTGFLRSVNPATGEQYAEYPAFTAAQIDAAVGALMRHSRPGAH